MTVTIQIHLSELSVLALAATVPDGMLILTDDEDVIQQKARYAVRSMIEGIIYPIVQGSSRAYIAGNHDLRDWPDGPVGAQSIS